MRGNRKENQEIALERIRILFDEAERRSGDRPELSDRYVRMAVDMSTKHNTAIPSELKKRYCKGCLSYLSPERFTARASEKQESVTIKCNVCGNIKRYPYRREKHA